MKNNQKVIDKILYIFPRLYFSTPIVRPHSVTVGTRIIELSELMDAIMWLFDVLVQESKQDFCLQGQLHDLVSRWYGLETRSSFTKTLNKLDDAKFIEKITDASDKRNNKIILTPDGKELLKQIQAERAEAIKPILQQWSKEHQGAVLQALETLALATWDHNKRR